MEYRHTMHMLFIKYVNFTLLAPVDHGNLLFDLAAATSAAAETPRHGRKHHNQRETVLRRREVGYLRYLTGQLNF